MNWQVKLSIFKSDHSSHINWQVEVEAYSYLTNSSHMNLQVRKLGLPAQWWSNQAQAERGQAHLPNLRGSAT